MLNLNQLRFFYEAAKAQNFTTAAKKLFVSQPAVTAQIRQLEDQATLKLFKKGGRKIFLTDEGKTLFEYVKKLFEYEHQIEHVIEDLKKMKRGTLRLGTTKTYARYFMPMILSAFCETYPQVKIFLDEGSSRDIMQSLLDFQNEIALIAKLEDDPRIRFIPFSQEELVLILSVNHPLRKKEGLRVEDLAEEPLIMKETGSATRKTVNDLFSSKGLSPNILMETGNTEFIKQVVQRGEGISFLVRSAVLAELNEKKLIERPLKGENLFLTVNLAHLEGQDLSRPAQAFFEIITNFVPQKGPEDNLRAIMTQMLENWQHSSGSPS
jgi:DNA-binding transcriptional LysR family regulator